MIRYRVARLEESAFAVPQGYAQHSRGYTRASLADHSTGSVHMGAGVCRLEPLGYVAARVHANEKGLYVLEGELELECAGRSTRLGPDDYALIPYGACHALRNPGRSRARWFEMQAPQPKPPGGWQDTFFVGDETLPAPVEPAAAAVGHFHARNPRFVSAEGVSGLAVYRFIERGLGAQHFFMMRGELAVGGLRSRHDHPVEELYFVLSGEAFMDIEHERFHLRPSDVAWTGVGASHAFHHRGDAPFRWLETQAPQFPERNGTRNYAEWERLARRASREG